MPEFTLSTFLDPLKLVDSIQQIAEADIVIAIDMAAKTEVVLFGNALFENTSGASSNRTLTIVRISIGGRKDLEKACELVVAAKGYHEERYYRVS